MFFPGGKKVPWFTVETVSNSNYDKENENENTLFRYNGCIPSKIKNKNDKKNNKNSARCVPIIKINNNSIDNDIDDINNNKKRKNRKDKYSCTESESLLICFNHIGVHYDCYELSGKLGEGECSV